MTRTPIAPVNPEVLRWAREDGGLSHEQLGRLAGVDALRVQGWESGGSAPTLAQLRRVADGLVRPVAFFLTAHPPQQHFAPPPDFREHRRAFSPALAREVRLAYERRITFVDIEETSETEWRGWKDDPPATPADVRARLGVEVTDVAEAADPLAALRLWIAAFEAQGILVFQMSRVDVNECLGFALYDEEVPVIVLNGAGSAQWRCLTLVHELMHLLGHTGAVCLLDDDEEKVEELCNRLAAEVLVPDDAVKAVVKGQGRASRVDAVARAFRVIPVVAAVRLRDLELVDPAAVDATLRESDEGGRGSQNQTGGPASYAIKRRNLGNRYVGAVLDALHRDWITLLDATYLLETNVGTVEQMEKAITGGAT